MPWKNADKWIKLFTCFSCRQNKTPTLLWPAKKISMYRVWCRTKYHKRLRNGVPAQLVIYPGQNHGISIPGYQVDRCERYRHGLKISAISFMEPAVVQLASFRYASPGRNDSGSRTCAVGCSRSLSVLTIFKTAY